MPLILDTEIDEIARVGVWQIDDSADEACADAILRPEEKERCNSFKSRLRRNQWLTCRILLEEMTGKGSSIIYDEFGKPSLSDSSTHFSLSHSGKYVALILSDTVDVGIDIERMKDRILNIRDKFLSEEEARELPSENLTEKLYVIWGAKESLYKCHGRPDVEFARDINVGPFDYLCNGKGRCSARMMTPDGPERFNVYYEEISGYMLVYTLKNVDLK